MSEEIKIININTPKMLKWFDFKLESLEDLKKVARDRNTSIIFKQDKKYYIIVEPAAHFVRYLYEEPK